MDAPQWMLFGLIMGCVVAAKTAAGLLGWRIGNLVTWTPARRRFAVTLTIALCAAAALHRALR